MQLKETLKTGLHSLLKRPPLETAVSRVVAWSGAWPTSQRRLVPFIPQPSTYRPGERRVIDRDGWTWHLEPHSYFQWHHYFGFHDQVLASLLDAVVPGDVVVDVGANVGLYAISVARAVGPSGHVFAVEPNPHAVERIGLHATLNGVQNLTPVPHALGAEGGTAQLGNAGSEDLGKFSLRPGDNQVGAVDVSVRTLDDLLASHGIDRLDLLKIDVEGFEPECLHGARASIERYWPNIAIEVSPPWYNRKMTMFREAMTVLAAGPYQWWEIGHTTNTPFDIGTWLSTVTPADPQRNLLALRTAPR